jgi:hypothetical protein
MTNDAETAASETVGMSAPESAAVKGDTLCTTGETPFFSCEIGTKRVSVCGGGTGAVYRFGTPGKVELTSRALAFANRGYSGGGESQVTATNGEYSYTVFDRTVRTSFDEGRNDPAFSSGLLVGRGGRVLSSRMCKGESPVVADAERARPAGTFVEH